MIKRNKNFDGILKQLDAEYNDVVLHNFKSHIKNFDYIDIADSYSKDAVTYGDSRID